MATSYTHTGGDVYYYWVSSNSGDATTTYATDYTWENWASGTSDEVTYDSTWSYWMEDKFIQPYKIARIARIAPKVKSIEEVRAARAQRRIDAFWRDEKIKEEEKRKKRAELTAHDLLEDLIGNAALARYRETGCLVVKGRKFDYVIQKGRGVYKVEKEKIIDLCIHFRNRYKYPETDNVIGLKLLIEANESKFLKTANSHGEVHNEVTRDKLLRLVERAA